MTPYEVWDEDELILSDIRDKRKAKTIRKNYIEIYYASSGWYKEQDVRIVYRTPSRYRGSPE